jgi:hypothetical protein
VSDNGPSYGWDAAAQRYRDLATGQYVSAADVQAVMQGRIDTAFERLSDMSKGLADGSVSLAEFQQAAMVELRRAYTQMAALGSGGWENVSNQTWGDIGSRLAAEYKYMAGFAQEIADGTLTEGQIEVRLNMYASGIWGGYYDSERNSMQEAGYTQEIRVLEGGAKHCIDCEDAAGHWSPINSLPDIGDSQCGSNCRCTFEYS